MGVLVITVVTRGMGVVIAVVSSSGEGIGIGDVVSIC